MENFSNRPALACILLGLALGGCSLQEETCDPEGCAKKNYAISAEIMGDASRRRIDTLDTGQLYVLVHLQQPFSLGKISASPSKCISCESLLMNSNLSFNQPILAGTDTLAASANLLDDDLVSKVGIGGRAALIFNREVRFKRGENRISFKADLVLNGRKIGSVSLEKTLFVGEQSSW